MEKVIEEYNSSDMGDGHRATVIKVIGVGGAGGNALNTMVRKMGDSDVEFIAANTDQQALSNSLANQKIPLGKSGLGAGMRPEVGFQAANEAREEIADKLRGADMVFITAGMGGGTGTGASPVVAEVAQELGILTVAVVTKPFNFEGMRRMKTAEQGLQQLKNRVHSLIVILNDRLEEELGEDATFKECFEKADEVLYNACSGIAELIQRVGYMNVDFEDVRTVMGARGTAMMGMGEAEGPDRAIAAASQAIACPLLEGVQLKGARGLLVNVTGSTGMRMSEFRTAMETVKNFADPDALVIAGSVTDDSLGEKLRVTVIATGLDQDGTDNFETDIRTGQSASPVNNSSQLWKQNTPFRTGAAETLHSTTEPAALGVDLFGAPMTETKPKAKAERHPEPKDEPKAEPQAQEPKPEVRPAEEVKEAKPEEKPAAAYTENPFLQPVSRPISTPDVQNPFPQNSARDNTVFGSFGGKESVRPASDVFATLNPQQGTNSGLWTTNAQTPAAEPRPVAKTEETPDQPRFEYGIPTFLRKKS
ncbi:cell division protein FtsZ [Parasutterella muris]|uniref:cell division protein FtsZ n=1 Tax=Parasutterella muris TaxID=2565572 RepID=UPI00351D083F